MKKLRRPDSDRGSPELPFINPAEGRLHHRKQAQTKQKETIESLQLSGKMAVLDDRFDHAYNVGTQLLKTAVEMHGMGSVELIPAYLLLGEASMGLSRIPQAEKYLSQAQWLMLKSPSCDDSVKCLVFRYLGLLYATIGQYEKARQTLADDIYHASMKYGCSDIRVASGYFHMGNVFFQEDRPEIANSFHSQVLTVWKSFFLQVSPSLGAADSDAVKSPVSPLSSQISVAQGGPSSLSDGISLDLAEQMEAINMLHRIRLSREKQIHSGMPSTMLLDVYYTLSLLYHYLENQSLMTEFAGKAVQLNKSQVNPNMELAENLTYLLNSAS